MIEFYPLLTPQPPDELQIPLFVVLTVVGIIRLVRSRQPPSDVTRDAARYHVIFGAGLAIVGVILTLATFAVDGSIAAYLVSVAALVGGLLYGGHGLFRR